MGYLSVTGTKLFSIREPVSNKVLSLEFRGWRDGIYRSWARGAFFELDVLNWCRDTVPDGGLFVDVGAHVGNHSVFFGAVLGAKVISVEPNLPLAYTVMRNMIACDLTPHVFPVGVSDKTGIGQVSLWATGYTTVPTVTVDNLLEAAFPGEPVSLLKIDVEGHELHVLRGADKIICRDYPAIAVESPVIGGGPERVITERLMRRGYGLPVRHGFMLCFSSPVCDSSGLSMRPLSFCRDVR